MKAPIQPGDLVKMKKPAGGLETGETVLVCGFRSSENYSVKVEALLRPGHGDVIRVWVSWAEIRRLKDDE